MTYKEEFIKFMSDSGVLTFGNFTLKSGRKAPYFINTGNYKKGSHLARLGEFYANCINENNLQGDILFGPAYKGIPLSVSTAISLYNKYKINMGYCFDRKEVKDHGEGGIFVGQEPKEFNKIIIIEDVITSGKAIKEVLPKLQTIKNISITGMIITVDRMERALDTNLSATQQTFKEHGIKIYSIVTIKDIILAIQNNIISGKEHLSAMEDYFAHYGVE